MNVTLLSTPRSIKLAPIKFRRRNGCDPVTVFYIECCYNMSNPFASPSPAVSTLSRSSVSSLNLSSLTLCDDSSRTSSPTPSLSSRGWGSTDTRRAYADLQSLTKAPQVMPRESSISSSEEESWGFFVESPSHSDSICW